VNIALEETRMRVYWDWWGWLVLAALAVVLLAISISSSDIFPNPFLTWSLRIIGIVIIIAVLALSRRKKLRNL